MGATCNLKLRRCKFRYVDYVGWNFAIKTFKFVSRSRQGSQTNEAHRWKAPGLSRTKVDGRAHCLRDCPRHGTGTSWGVFPAPAGLHSRRLQIIPYTQTHQAWRILRRIKVLMCSYTHTRVTRHYQFDYVSQSLAYDCNISVFSNKQAYTYTWADTWMPGWNN